MNLSLMILSLFLIPLYTTALPSKFYSGLENYEFNCSFQFKSAKALDCGCIDGLWKFYKTECQELMMVGGDTQFCFQMNQNVIRGEMILPDQHSLAVVKEGAVIPLLMNKLPIAGEEGDEIYAGKEWTLSDDDGNSICLATHPNSYCVFRASDFGLFQITQAKAGCEEEMYSVLPRNCFTMHSENKNICDRHRIMKRQTKKKRKQQGRTVFGTAGQNLQTSNGTNNTFDEDYVNETLLVIPEDSFASEIFNYMDAKLNEILDIHEPTTDFNFIFDQSTIIVKNRTKPTPRPNPSPSQPDNNNLEDVNSSEAGKGAVKNKTYIDLAYEETDTPPKTSTSKKTYVDLPDGPSTSPKITKKIYVDINDGPPSSPKNTKKTYVDLNDGSPSSKQPTKGKIYIDQNGRSKRATKVSDSNQNGGQSEITQIIFENRAPVYQLLELSKRVMAKTCPSFYVPPEFLDIAVSAFIRVNQKYYQFPEDDSYYYGYGRIVKSLLECEDQITPFNFTEDPCRTRNQPVSGAYCAFGKCDMEVNILAGFENFDPLIETAWNVFVNAHAACFPFFEDTTYNDHHKFLTWMTPLFQTDINDSWRKGNATGIVYGGIFGNAENLMAALTYCTASQRLESEYPWDIPRPNKAEDLALISNLRRKREVFYDEPGLSGHCSLPQTTGDCGINKLT